MKHWFTLFFSALLPVFAMAQGLPQFFTPLEYIASDGNAWFDTGIEVGKVRYFDVEATFAITGPFKRTDENKDFPFPGEIEHSWLFGAATSINYKGEGSGVDMWGPVCWNSRWMQPRRSGGVAHAGLRPLTDVKYTFRHIYKSDFGVPKWLPESSSGWYFLNGKPCFERGGTAAYKNGFSEVGKKRTIYLFGCNVNGKAGQLCSAKIWSVKIYGFTSDGKKVLYFCGIPCKNTSKVVGMYDTVSRRFFSSRSASQFVAGPTISRSSSWSR